MTTQFAINGAQVGSALDQSGFNFMTVSSMHFDTFKKLGERTSNESDSQVPQNHQTLIQRNMSPSPLYDLDLNIAAPLDPKRYN